MKKMIQIFIVACLLVTSCSGKKEPVVPVTKVYDCVTSCENVRKLSCLEYVNVACTVWDDGCPESGFVTCEKWCSDTVNKGSINLDFKCMSTATTCQIFDGC